MKKVTAYKCSFCKDSSRSIFLSRSGCYKHEKKCWLNPERKSCATCNNLYTNIDDENPNWHCSILIGIMPFKNKIENCRSWKKTSLIFGHLLTNI